MRCPNCSGWSHMIAFSKVSPIIICDICGGTGELPEGMEYNMNKGYTMRIDRLSMNLTLRAYCLEYGIDAAERSKKERGFFKV